MNQTSQKLQSVDEKIQQLKVRKQQLLQKEKTKQRKRLNKQKILLGGYYMNLLKSLDEQKQQEAHKRIIETIPESRKNDRQAIDEFFKELSTNE